MTVINLPPGQSHDTGQVGSDRLKSMHLVCLHLRAVGSHGRSCMALKLVWRLVNTVSKEGPEVYRMVSSA